jgi:hypothetical protein
MLSAAVYALAGAGADFDYLDITEGVEYTPAQALGYLLDLDGPARVDAVAHWSAARSVHGPGLLSASKQHRSMSCWMRSRSGLKGTAPGSTSVSFGASGSGTRGQSQTEQAGSPVPKW